MLFGSGLVGLQSYQEALERLPCSCQDALLCLIWTCVFTICPCSSFRIHLALAKTCKSYAKIWPKSKFWFEKNHHGSRKDLFGSRESQFAVRSTLLTVRSIDQETKWAIVISPRQKLRVMCMLKTASRIRGSRGPVHLLDSSKIGHCDFSSTFLPWS